MKLSDYAKKLGITYRTAWNHYKAGQIPNAKKLPSGLIIVDDEMIETKERTAVYARVSSSENKVNLISQSKRVQDFCAAKPALDLITSRTYGTAKSSSLTKLSKTKATHCRILSR